MSVMEIPERGIKMRISEKVEQEQHLLNLANNLIGKFQVPKAFTMVINISAKQFHRALYDTGIGQQLDTFIKQMNLTSIAEIICVALSDGHYALNTNYRVTYCQDVLGECENIFKKLDDGEYFIRELAKAVLIAAMYDILITESWIMNVEEGCVDGNLVVYEPKPRMKIFVRSTRLHDLLA